MPYTRAQIALHWIIAALVAAQFLTGDAMSEAFEAVMETEAAAASAAATAHRATGVAVVVLALVRLGLRLRHGAPPHTPQSPRWDIALARAAHVALYALIVLVPASGMAAWALASEAAGEAHEVLKTVLMLTVIAHIAGAAYHQLVLRDGLLRRMVVPGARG